ncbi:MAG TPA: hypothetical protein VNU71_06385, partial [Burkholderiaceae bacterium]|nr:hypothetical protein [Burkholderiaceae bacterium]
FARIVLTPNAKTDGVRHVLVIEPTGLQMPARPDVPVDDPKAATAKKGAKAPAKAASAAAPKAASAAASKAAP